MSKTAFTSNSTLECDVVIRPFRDTDYSFATQLHQIVYKQPISLALWNWLTKDNPAGFPISYVAEEKDRLVGVGMLIPTQMKIGAVVVTAYHGGPIVHPEYRRRRIFTRIAAQGFDELERRRGVFYGFSNAMVFPHLVQKQGHADLGSASKFSKVYNPLYSIQKKFKMKNNIPFQKARNALNKFLARKSSGASKAQHCQIEALRDFDQRFDALWEKSKNQYDILVIRDKKYLKWRFLNHPDQKNHIFALDGRDGLEGYLVLRISEETSGKIGFIEDVFVSQPKFLEAALLFADQWFQDKKCDVGNFYFFGKPVLDQTMKALRFKTRTAADHLMVKVCSPGLDKTSVGGHQQWFLTSAEFYFA